MPSTLSWVKEHAELLDFRPNFFTLSSVKGASRLSLTISAEDKSLSFSNSSHRINVSTFLNVSILRCISKKFGAEKDRISKVRLHNNRSIDSQMNIVQQLGGSCVVVVRQISFVYGSSATAAQLLHRTIQIRLGLNTCW